jgi:DNA-binding response OmpR family regulator
MYMGARARILLVDDEPSICFLMAASLEDAGYEVVVSHSVNHAKRLLLSEIPNVVIVDIMMGDESGFALLAHIRKNPDTRSIPVVVSSALEVEREAFHEGANIFLPKPFSAEKLVDVINALASKEGAPQLMDRALGLLKERKFVEAKPLLHQVLDLESQGTYAAYAAFYLGEISRAENQSDAAESHYKTAVQFSPDFWRAYRQLGKLCSLRKDYHRALTYWKKSLLIQPNQPDIQDAIKQLQSFVR